MGTASKDPYEGADKALLEAIGLAIVNFSQLEYAIRLGISVLLVGIKADDGPDLVTSRLGFRALLDLYACLHRLRFPEDEDEELRREFERLEKLNDRRNQLVHSLWGIGATPTTLTQFTTVARRKGAVLSQIQVSERDVLALAVDMDEARIRVWDRMMPLMVRIDERLPK